MKNYVTMKEVHDAANKIDAQGKKPGVRGIRELIGRGGNTTIETYLATWVPVSQVVDLPPMSPEVYAAVSAMAEDFWYFAKKTSENEVAAAVSKMEQERDAAQAAVTRLGDSIDKLTEENRTQSDQIIVKDQTIAERDRQIAELTQSNEDSAKLIGKLDAQVEMQKNMLTELGPLVQMLATSKKLKASVARGAKPAE
jgi:septal ring factor EnvC (AmiA/AmiB activator)